MSRPGAMMSRPTPSGVDWQAWSPPSSRPDRHSSTRVTSTTKGTKSRKVQSDNILGKTDGPCLATFRRKCRLSLSSQSLKKLERVRKGMQSRQQRNDRRLSSIAGGSDESRPILFEMVMKSARIRHPMMGGRYSDRLHHEHSPEVFGAWLRNRSARFRQAQAFGAITKFTFETELFWKVTSLSISLNWRPSRG